MAKIQRNQVIQAIQNELQLSANADVIPSQTEEKLRVTYDVSDKYRKPFSQYGILENSTSQTIFTTSSNEDTYITSVTLNITKNATAVAREFYLRATNYYTNSVQHLLSAFFLTLTATNQTLTLNFSTPFRCKRGTVVNLITENATGEVYMTASVAGFTTDIIQ